MVSYGKLFGLDFNILALLANCMHLHMYLYLSLYTFLSICYFFNILNCAVEKLYIKRVVLYIYLSTHVVCTTYMPFLVCIPTYITVCFLLVCLSLISCSSELPCYFPSRCCRGKLSISLTVPSPFSLSLLALSPFPLLLKHLFSCSRAGLSSSEQ